MRADRRTKTGATDEIYSDFDISFARNPVTGALARVTNDESIKQSIKNIIMTTRGEWAHHPTLGSKIYHLLFEPLDDDTADTMRDLIDAALRYEPRAEILETDISVNQAKDGYDMRIVFRTRNTSTPVVFSDFIKRVR